MFKKISFIIVLSSLIIGCSACSLLNGEGTIDKTKPPSDMTVGDTTSKDTGTTSNVPDDTTALNDDDINNFDITADQTSEIDSTIDGTLSTETTDECTDAGVPSNEATDKFEIPAEELYMQVYNDNIEHRDVPLYKSFQNSVIEKTSEIVGSDIIWKDITVFIRDNPHEERYPYVILISNKFAYCLVIESGIVAEQVNNKITYCLEWSSPYHVYGQYSVDEGIISVNSAADIYACINKTKLLETLHQYTDILDYNIKYQGIGLYDNIITVPLCSGGKFALAKVQIGSDLFYNMLSVEAINIEELTPYDFFKYNCLGLEPLDLMEYNIPISINPYAMLQEYYKTIENVSSIYEVSGFSPTPYIRIHYDNTDVFFELINTATNTPINNIADITNDVSYDELSWESSRSYIREDQ